MLYVHRRWHPRVHSPHKRRAHAFFIGRRPPHVRGVYTGISTTRVQISKSIQTSRMGSMELNVQAVIMRCNFDFLTRVQFFSQNINPNELKIFRCVLLNIINIWYKSYEFRWTISKVVINDVAAFQRKWNSSISIILKDFQHIFKKENNLLRSGTIVNRACMLISEFKIVKH